MNVVNIRKLFTLLYCLWVSFPLKIKFRVWGFCIGCIFHIFLSCLKIFQPIFKYLVWILLQIFIELSQAFRFVLSSRGKHGLVLNFHLCRDYKHMDILKGVWEPPALSAQGVIQLQLMRVTPALLFVYLLRYCTNTTTQLL